MANNCFYDMVIAGTKEDCREWVNRMQSDSAPNSFYRIFNADIVDEGGIAEDYHMEIEGYCAWSLDSCCRAGGYSNGIDLFAVNTKELNLDMEAYSSEPLVGFEEHYRYRKGKCELAVDRKCRTYYVGNCKSLKAARKEYPDLPAGFSKTDLDRAQRYFDGTYKIGGFLTWYFAL